MHHFARTTRFIDYFRTATFVSFLLVAPSVWSADPESGSLDANLGDIVAWVGTAPGGVNPGPALEDHDSACTDGSNCEFFVLELTGLPLDWEGKKARVDLNWQDITTDYDVYVHRGAPDGPVVEDSTDGPTNSESLELDPASSTVGTGIFYVHVVYFAATDADQYSGKATVVAKTRGLSPAPIDTGLPPRYQTHTPTQAQLAAGMTRNSQDEPNIGVNWESGSVILQALLQTLKVDFNDLACPQTPDSAWEDISPPTAQESFDPILFTDHETNRTFVSHLLFNPIVDLTSYTDNDGETWIPSEGKGAGGGIDHQTMGGGPWADPAPPNLIYPNSVFYCAQDIAFANCSFSLDGGITFGPAIPMYHVEQCDGLHGHIKIAPDGTAYVPNAACLGEVNPNENAVAVSEDNGITWEVRTVPGTVGAGGSDPSVGIATDGTVYFGFVDDDKIPAVAVSHDKGRTWSNVYDVGHMLGIKSAVFPAMVAGDPDRAAMAFYGTTADGNANHFASEGEWYLFVAHTYDGGNSWITVNATPNDPLQRGGIHLGGGGSVHRNLLDFFDSDIDAEGRNVVGYADGCVGACATAPDGARGNSYTAFGKIARQSGGRRLFAAYDPAEPTVPGAPTLTAARNGSDARLAISLSEDGGSPVSALDVYRARDGEAEQLVASLDGSAHRFNDSGLDPNATYSYRVEAFNALGASCGDNTFVAPPSGDSCSAGGWRVVTDASGDHDGAPLNPDMDIEWVSIGEPYFEGGERKLVFTMKVASLETLVPQRMWRILWSYPDAPDPGSGIFAGAYWIGMDTDASGEVSFSYGITEDFSAVLIGVVPSVRIGDADPESSQSADGTIRLVISADKVGAPQAGDLIGDVLARTYPVAQDQTLRSTGAVDSASLGETYALVGNAACQVVPTSECFEDDATEIAYGKGWHELTSADASEGHFYVKPGKNPNSGMSLEFEVDSGAVGTLTYQYGKSKRGGTADVYIDGEYVETIDYDDGSSALDDPDFGHSTTYDGLSAGTHVFELRNVVGAVYVDEVCLENAGSDSEPPMGPGGTSVLAQVIGLLGSLVEEVQVPASAEAVSVVAAGPESSSFDLLLIDPLGLTVRSVRSESGIAVIEENVSGSGTYIIKVVNLKLGSLDVWTATTPWVQR